MKDKLGYMTIKDKMSIDGYVSGTGHQKKYEIPCEIYTRCVGYYRPINQMNPGKKSEVSERVPYKVAL